MDDLTAKVFHEAVAHLGLKEMMNRIDNGLRKDEGDQRARQGEKGFNKLLRGVWNGMSEASRDEFAAYVYSVRPNLHEGKSSDDYNALTDVETETVRNDSRVQLEAANEYIAHLAERRALLEVSDESENANAIRKAWHEFVDFFRQLFHSLTGADLTVTDEGLAKLIHLSYTELKRQAIEGASTGYAATNRASADATTNS